MHLPRVSLPRPSRLLATGLVVVLVAGCGGTTASPATGQAAPAPTQAAAASEAAEVTPLPGGPAIATPADGPTVIDVPSEVVVSQAIPADGATLVAEGLSVVVPAGAAADGTTVQVTRLDAPFQQNPYARDEPGSLPAVPLGSPVDFGPAGVAFSSPVSVTLAYDPAAIPDGYDGVAIAYWSGERWAYLGGIVDAAAHTVTVTQDAFEGEIFTTIAVATVAGIAINQGIKWWYGEKAYTDPIIEKKAGGWVAPKDPNVEAAAKTTTVGGVPVSDKQKLEAYLKGNTSGSAPIRVTGADGQVRGQTYSAGTGSNWQAPGAYLSTGGMKGDCTDVTNAMVSIFRNLGYPAKAVFGYAGDKNSPHAWGEVIIGGQPYLVDEEGNLQKLDDAMKAAGLIRPDPGDPRAFMWDENGQVPYRADWWDATLINGSYTGTFTLTEVTIDEAMLKEAEDQGCSVALLDAIKGKALPMTMVIKVDAAGKGTAVMKINTSSVKGPDGKPLKSEPQTFKVTYADPVLAFKMEASGGATSSMSGRVTAGEGGGSAINGTTTMSGKGFSAKAVWTGTRS
ncbi:MAG TPA: transglutaminase domain-containing protein [Candidatus Limnocylindrales bacterium]|nr:transglutaminase domain-containing protein [Candidatus Limnocylindrales bacterium]